MRRPPTWSLLWLLSACDAQISDVPPDGTSAEADAAPGVDAGIDAVRLGPWSPPLKVPAAATAATEDDVTLSSDGLELIFAIAAGGSKDLYYTSRASRDAPWSPATMVPFDSPFSEETPRFSPDDKTLYFSSDRAGIGSLDIYAVPHAAPDNLSWGTVREIASVNTAALVEKWYAPCAGGHYALVQTAGNATDLFEGIQGGGAPTPIDVLNTTATETGAFLTRDCLTIYFASNRLMPEQIYTSHRDSLTSPWKQPAPVVDFATLGGNQEDPWLSADGRVFVFASNAGGNKDIYISTR
jgi:hypothetical protein